MANELAELQPNGKIRLSLHPGQWQAWNAQERFILVLAGSQSGKTSFGPHWLYREIQRCGPGDYMVAAPTYRLLSLKLIPEFYRLFKRWMRLGSEVGGLTNRFVFSDDGCRRTFGYYNPDIPTQVIFSHASDPESLESATAKAAWLDEAGQKRFKLGSWEAILRRLALAQGRVLLTTTPYDLGWLKQQVFDRWKAGEPEYRVVRFDSTENPQFPRNEWERARREMPMWKFNMFYRGIFSRPAGLIYDSFLDAPAPRGHLVPRFNIPEPWDRYVGLDFGGVNTAAVFYGAEAKPDAAEIPVQGYVVLRPPSLPALIPTGRLFLYRTYLAGSRTANDHVEHILRGEPRIPTCVGGSRSEQQWRDEFARAGLPIAAPNITDVEIGIQRVYAAHATNRIWVFDDLDGYREQKTTYSRELDRGGEPTERIEDKETFHFLDAERYVIGYLQGGSEGPEVI